MKIKSWSKNIGVTVVENGCGYSGHKTVNKICCISRRNYLNKLLFDVLIQIQINSRQIQVTLIIFGWSWPKNGFGLLGHDSIISCIPRMNWWNKQIDWLFHTGSDGRTWFNCQSTLYRWHLNAWGRKLKVTSTILGCLWLKMAMGNQVTRSWNWLYLKSVLLKNFD